MRAAPAVMAEIRQRCRGGISTLNVVEPTKPGMLPGLGTQMATRDLTAVNFKHTLDANTNVLVYFWAPLCGPCEVLTPTYQASSNKHFDVVHGKVNIETEQGLVSLAQVKFLPTLMAFKNGKAVFKQPGIADAATMDELVRHLRAYRFGSAAADESVNS